MKELFSPIKKSDDKKQAGQKEDEAKQAIQQKIETPILSVGVRLVVSAESKSRAESILSDIESAFHQFENTLGNALIFEYVTRSECATA
jgi:predicted GTPase